LNGIEDKKIRMRRFLQQRIDSILVSDIPDIFDCIGRKSYRDGFCSVHLHQKVDGHSHFVTIIGTTKGFLFGGYMA
jgi:hypothetical protein